MPLQTGSSQKTISGNIHEMVMSEGFGQGKSQKKRQQMAAAAAYEKAGKSRKGKKGKKSHRKRGKKDHKPGPTLSNRAMSTGRG